MSTQVQQKPLPPEWQPKRREQGGLRQVRRDGNGQLTFKGQEKDETVKRVVRPHPMFLLKPALPALASGLGLVLVSLLFIRFPEFNTLWALLDLVLAIALLITLGYFIWKDFLVWWVNITIITNKRVILCQGFLQPTRKIITLDKITQVSVHLTSFWSTFIKYGNVHIYIAGGENVLKNVSKPNEVRDAIHGIFQDFKAAVAAKPVEKVVVVDPEINSIIAKLGKKEELPFLPNADERYSHRQNPEKLRRPLRRFGGPLRIPAEITYASDEQTVMYIQRSKWILIAKLFAPGMATLIALVLTFVLPVAAIFTVTAAVILLISMALITINYVDDLFILTNKRVIDIERKFIFFYEERVEAEYKNIRDIKIKITNIFQNMLDVGNLYIETPGNSPDINMTLIDHPYFVADKINQVKGFKDKLDKAKAKNERQEELSKWFTGVVSVLEKKMVSQGVPNLQKMDLWTAASVAAEIGLKVVPIGEDDSYPQIEAGKIVSQNPMPGTLLNIDPKATERLEIHVILSKRG